MTHKVQRRPAGLKAAQPQVRLPQQLQQGHKRTVQLLLTPMQLCSKRGRWAMQG